jgi:para-nitrobenzyl esterase
VSPDIVHVEGGSVSGIETNGVRSFRGIPYAAPPLGDLRWRPPQVVVPWEGIRDGSAYGAECPQPQYPSGSIYVRPLPEQSEDCLFLNVWTTAKAGDKRPVLVWVHGGSLTRGSSTSDIRDGSVLAKRDIVLVSFNYRLGALGYLAHPELTAESPRHASGNYGVLDQIAALQWVHKNIAAFGGDPERVTVGGESAGAWSVCTLLASPLGKGLFIRAIGQSGARFFGTPLLHDDRPGMISAESVGLALAKTVGATSLKDLRALPADALFDVSGFRTQETVDDWVLPDEVHNLFAKKKHNNVPVIVGSTADEMTSLISATQLPKTLDDYRRHMQIQFNDLAPEFEVVYGVKDEGDIARAVLASWRDTIFSVQMRTWARMTTTSGSDAYLYLFSHVPPSPRRTELGAFHASEIPYVFNVLTSGDSREAGFEWTEADRLLADRISSYWANFVATGDPNGEGLPAWMPYDQTSEPYLEFRDPIRSGNHLFKAQLDLQERALTRSRY